MPCEMRYDAVLFDAGDTLLRPEPSFSEALGGLLRARGVDVPDGRQERVEEALVAAVGRLKDDGRSFSTSHEESRSFWMGLYAAVLADLGVPDPGGDLAAYLYREFSRPERYALFPDVLPALRELRARGYRLGVLSNFERFLLEVLELRGVAPLLECSVVSGIEGVEKPDERIFRCALDRLGLAPARVCYVGDSPTVDIEPALALGMGAVLVDRHGRHPGLPGIESLEQIAAFV